MGLYGSGYLKKGLAYFWILMVIEFLVFTADGYGFLDAQRIMRNYNILSFKT